MHFWSNDPQRHDYRDDVHGPRRVIVGFDGSGSGRSFREAMRHRTIRVGISVTGERSDMGISMISIE